MASVSAANLARKKARVYTEAVAAGYVSPYPTEPTPVVTDRCDGCGWTLYESLAGEVFCLNSSCASYRMTIEEYDGHAAPASAETVQHSHTSPEETQ